MNDDLAFKTVPLPLASLPGRVRGTKEERAARVQAHMDRVHPHLAAVKAEERRVHEDAGDVFERARVVSRRKSYRKLLALARERGAAIAGRRRT